MKRIGLNVEVLSVPDTEVTRYVQRTSAGRLCHLPEWGFAVAQILRHEALYLVAREEARVRGVLPLTIVKSRLFGNRLISQAFSNYGGPLADSPAVLAALLGRACELAPEHRCSVLELRGSERLPGDLALREDKICMVLPLTADPNEIWQGLKPEIRNRVRKADKCGLAAVSGGDELLDEFYDVWTIRMRQLGTPCYSRHVFQALLRCFPTCTRVFLVRDGPRTLAAGFFHQFNGLVECRWAAARTDAKGLSPNTLLYWSAIKHYCLTGQRQFDFGRSTIGSGPHEFKRRWGATQSQLYYQYWTEPNHELSPIRPDNPRYKRVVAMWKRLPLCATRILGPSIGRCLA